jgi:3',5'-cyclic AMP phosphodiesterase CpdA
MITRLLHLSDVHFGGENVGAAEAVIAFAIAEAADLILVTGDLTLNGLPREFEAAARWLQRLPTPRLVTPGNHDTPYWNLLLRALTPFARYQRYIGTAGGEDFDGPTVAARTINTARGAQPRPDWSKGAIDLEQCRLTVCDLAAGAPGALKVVACHHPLVEALDTPVTGGVHRGEEAARVLARGGADLILTGHVHNPFASPLKFGDEHTYAVGAGTLSTRTRGTPPGFNCITADAETITVAAQGWTGSHFKPYRTWGLPRRRLAAQNPEKLIGSHSA